MPRGIGERLQSAWNAFFNKDPTETNDGYEYQEIGPVEYSSPSRPILSVSTQRSIVNQVYNRIALDVSAITIQHVRLDDNNRFKEVIDSRFNKCLNLSANIDQTGRAFIQDAVLSMFDEGCVALVPIDTTTNPYKSTGFDIETIRTGRIIQWYPYHVTVEVYNIKLGKKVNITVPKASIGIIENPFYAVMNEPNSTAKRLINKLSLLDYVDQRNGSGRLNLIISFPHLIRTDLQRQQAEKRKVDIETQLENSRYGIAYTDGTEHITQLNRSIDNNLFEQVKTLTEQLFNELGMPMSVFDGSANEETLLNYQKRTIEVIVAALVNEMKRKFLSKTAITQRQSIMYFNDPFRFVPTSDIAEIADKFTRNEILTSNEVRQIVGIKPAEDPKADRLVNSNISQAKQENTNNELLEEIQNERSEV